MGIIYNGRMYSYNATANHTEMESITISALVETIPFPAPALIKKRLEHGASSGKPL